MTFMCNVSIFILFILSMSLFIKAAPYLGIGWTNYMI